jgi:hypothetical protein
MTDVVRDAITAELALLQRERRTPTAPFGYGTDLSCSSDLTPTMASVDAFSTRAISEAIVRRLDTPRGALVDDPDYGTDLRGFLNRGATAAELNALSDKVRAEVQRDDRVRSATVSLRMSEATRTLRVDIAVALVGTDGAFRMTLAVTSADILIEELRG